MIPVNVRVPVMEEVIAKDGVVHRGCIYDQTIPFEAGKGRKVKSPWDFLFEHLQRLRRGKGEEPDGLRKFARHKGRLVYQTSIDKRA